MGSHPWVKTVALVVGACVGGSAWASPPPAGDPLAPGGLYFDFDEDTPRVDQTAKLQEIVGVLKQYPAIHISVDGYTDSVGDPAYNQALSERRARGIHARLLAEGVPPASLRPPAGYGETRPIARETRLDGTDDANGRALNRRVEASVVND